MRSVLLILALALRGLVLGQDGQLDPSFDPGTGADDSLL